MFDENHDDTQAETARPAAHERGPWTPSAPDFLDTLANLQGGRFAEMLTTMLADCAMAVAAQDGKARQKGKLVVTFELEPTNSDELLDVVHRAEFKHPTLKGWKAEQVGDVHPMFVNRKGALTVVKDEQGRFDFGA